MTLNGDLELEVIEESNPYPEESKREVKSNQKHLMCKKRGGQELKQEKDVKSNGRPMPPGFDRLVSFSHHELTAKHCYFRCSKPPDVDGIKIFDKDQATKH